MGRTAGWFAAFGTCVAAAAVRLSRRSLLPLGEEATAALEVEAARRHGFEIGFRQRPARRVWRLTFIGRHDGRSVGWLDVHFLLSGRLLYVENVYVAESHGRRGLAAALLIAAAKTTDCTAVATSGRTSQGAAFFARCRSTLKRHGIELRDGPP